jgi:GH25 family lysozyme M1 (1,4-beta-N-acetylmuramidase)
MINLYISIVGLTIIMMGCGSPSQDEVKKRADKIASEIIKIKTINDFNSNMNKPVPDVENIGKNLYRKIRQFQKKRPVKHTIKKIDCSKYSMNRSGEGTCFIVIYINSSEETMRFFMKYSNKDDLFRITGY